jgi:hypothetical protein
MVSRLYCGEGTDHWFAKKKEAAKVCLAGLSKNASVFIAVGNKSSARKQQKGAENANFAVCQPIQTNTSCFSLLRNEKRGHQFAERRKRELGCAVLSPLCTNASVSIAVENRAPV